jgi:outer membrane biosynthesis protein TonB|tara:strand:+ start:1593 stop:2600 length:1008 start_codon:yes stop_codon:yes gene_type:complete
VAEYRQGLPWNQEAGERKRLFAVATLVVPLFLVAAAYITWVELPEQDRKEREALPPQLAKLIVEKQEPPPPPELKAPEPEPEPELEPEKPEPKEQPVAEPEPQVQPPAPEPEPEPEPEPQVAEKPEPTQQDVEKAREKAKNTGILAMGDELSKLSALGKSVKLDTPATVTTAEPIARKTGDTLAQKANTGRSSGVDESGLTRETREVALAERQRAQVEEAEEVVAQAKAAEREQQAAASKRSREELRRTMDANKSAIYSIYNRELRRKPSLQGSVTPELVIEENGAVSSCSVVESTLNEPALEKKICNRLRLVDFGARPGVDRTTIRYPIELLSG